MPIRWFIRGNVLWADAWSMTVVVRENESTWEVREWETIEVAASDLLLSFPRFREMFKFYGLPDPANIPGQNYLTVRHISSTD
jgi:hypothetical protein